jgi:hypothetical protein
VRRVTIVLVTMLAGASAAAAAVHVGAWKGDITNLDGATVGSISFTVAGAKITKLKATLVTGCGAKLTVQPDKPIAIKAKAFTASVKAPDGLKITLKGTINARSARGIYTTGPKCKVEGRLRARAST